MDDNKRIHYIPSIPQIKSKRVGIYCRVSTNSAEQLQSLAVQISHLTKVTAATPQWLLVDAYIDVSSSKTGSSRTGFNRMLEDCASHKLDIILTKSISRFGRDTVETLSALNSLEANKVRVIFEQEDLDTANVDSKLLISILEGIAQAENESRSENIKWGIKERAASGSSKLFNRVCYGYKHDSEGNLVIDDETAGNVKLIFNLYLQGSSVLGIIKELEKRGIPSPTSREKWCKRTIDVMLSNEKYTGEVRLLKSSSSEVLYLSQDNNPAIISEEVFKAVQIEKSKRSNVVTDNEGTHRSRKKYSSRR